MDPIEQLIRRARWRIARWQLNQAKRQRASAENAINSTPEMCAKLRAEARRRHDATIAQARAMIARAPETYAADLAIIDALCDQAVADARINQLLAENEIDRQLQNVREFA